MPERPSMPESWVSASLTDICEILDHKRVPVNNRERNRRIAGRLDAHLYPYFGATGQVGVIDDFIFEGQHILLGEDGAPFLEPLKDQAYLVQGRFWVNNHAHILRSMISNKYVYHYLNTVDYSSYVTGTTRLKLTKNALTAIPIHFPSIAEQYRIVAKIEELFSELEKGIECLKKARAQLSTYRQAFLKHAFDGKLTAQWREENKDRLETPEQLLTTIKEERVKHHKQKLRDWRTAVAAWDEQGRRGAKPRSPRTLPTVAGLSRDVISKLPTLADSWAWGKLGWMTCGVEYGTATKSAPSGEVPVLRMGNVRGAKLDLSDLVYTSDGDEIDKLLLHDGDVLFNRTNSPELVGKTAIYRGSKPAIFAGYLIRINHIWSVVDGQYLNLFLNSRIARHYGNSVKTDGVNQSNINGAKLLNYPFPYCSIEEQRKIVNTLDRVLSVVDKMENEIAKQLDSAAALRQAILKRAFSGKLVPQDPSDEPASILLDRIRAERERITKGTTRRKKAKVTA
jgi:type I restriction enzyme S subunit